MHFVARTAIPLLAAVATMMVGAPAFAQDAPPMVELSKAQLDYSQKAIEALKDEDFARAVEYYNLALKLGESNVLYASLGRALFQAGDCKAADANYVKALSAPTVPQPPPAAVTQKIEEYRIGLKIECKGSLAVTCDPADKMEVRIGDGARRPCSDFPIALEPGSYKVLAFAYEVSISREIKIVGMEESSLNLSIEKPAVVGGGGGKKGGGGEFLGTLAYVSGSLGVALLGTAAVIDVTALDSAISDLEKAAPNTPEQNTALSDAESLQSLTLITYIGGAALLAVGGVLFVLAPDAPAEAEVDAEGASLDGWVSPDSAGVLWTVPW